MSLTGTVLSSRTVSVGPSHPMHPTGNNVSPPGDLSDLPLAISTIEARPISASSFNTISAIRDGTVGTIEIASTFSNPSISGNVFKYRTAAMRTNDRSRESDAECGEAVCEEAEVESIT